MAKISVTAGMAKTFARKPARKCKSCEFAFPRYTGRYPKCCPRCGADDIIRIDEGHSMSPRIRDLFERADQVEGWFQVSYEDLDEIFGGVRGLAPLIEGPVDDMFYRLESPDGSVLIFEFDDNESTLYMAETSSPEGFLGFDPRDEIVDEDWDSTFEPFLAESSEDRVARSVVDEWPKGRGGFKKSIKVPEARKVVLAYLKNNGYARDYRATKDVWIHSSGKSRVTFLRSNLVFEKGGRGNWVRDRRYMPYMEPVRTKEFAERIFKLSRKHLGESLNERRRHHGRTEPYEIDRDQAQRRETKLERVDKPTRSSIRRRRKQGEGPTQIYGGFRIHTGKNKNRKPRKDVQRAIQNKRNARRGLAKRVSASKKWHRSSAGSQYHDALGRYNRGRHRGESYDLRHRIADVRERITRFEGLQESADKSLDEIFEDILRVLIASDNLDVLQDVEFDDENGSIYLFFDPSLGRDEIETIHSQLRAKHQLEIVGDPEADSNTDWWVLFLPGQSDGVAASPDPDIYGSGEPQPGQKQQVFVKGPPSTPETIAQGVDVTKLLKSMK